MTRNSSKHPHATYRTLNSCFDLIGSHQQCIPWSPPLEIEPATSECRNRTSTNRLCVAWTGGPLVEVRFLHSGVAGSIFSGGDHGMKLLMRPNKVKTAVQCSVCRMWVFARFSSHDNLINIYIYIWVCMYV